MNSTILGCDRARFLNQAPTLYQAPSFRRFEHHEDLSSRAVNAASGTLVHM